MDTLAVLMILLCDLLLLSGWFCGIIEFLRKLSSPSEVIEQTVKTRLTLSS